MRIGDGGAEVTKSTSLTQAGNSAEAIRFKSARRQPVSPALMP
jgi:hypothetical protein